MFVLTLVQLSHHLQQQEEIRRNEEQKMNKIKGENSETR